MISTAFSKFQISRLSGLDYFPSEPAAVKELVEALLPSCDENAARATVSDLLYSSRECPKPADIRRVTFDKNERIREEKQAKLNACQSCHGIGFVAHERVIAGQTYSTASPCTECRT